MTKAALEKDYHKAESVLYVALELSASRWQLAFSIGLGKNPRRCSTAAGDQAGFGAQVKRAKQRFGLAGDAPVMSCYEAGRDGFWVHRWLQSQGVINQVVDSSSIEVNRRARRAKSDGLDVEALLRMLLRWAHGDKAVWKVVRVPSRRDEDNRQLHRELKTCRRTRTAISNRIRGLLACHGVRVKGIGAGLAKQLAKTRCWDGRGLPAELLSRLEGEIEHWSFVHKRIAELKKQRRRRLADRHCERMNKIRQMQKLRAIGVETSWLLEHEIFGWRRIANGKQLGSLLGLTPSPYQSGRVCREQGISKAGNRHVRALAVEVAWMWLRLQPQSELSRWYQRRFAEGGTRARKVGIVAVARKLMIQLWRFRETGEIPAGALLKSQPA